MLLLSAWVSPNRQSGRVESAQAFLLTMQKKEIERGTLVFQAGDLNEPSQLDIWTGGVIRKRLRDHRRCIVNWGCIQIVAQVWLQRCIPGTVF